MRPCQRPTGYPNLLVLEFAVDAPRAVLVFTEVWNINVAPRIDDPFWQYDLQLALGGSMSNDSARPLGKVQADPSLGSGHHWLCFSDPIDIAGTEKLRPQSGL